MKPIFVEVDIPSIFEYILFFVPKTNYDFTALKDNIVNYLMEFQKANMSKVNSSYHQISDILNQRFLIDLDILINGFSISIPKVQIYFLIGPVNKQNAAIMFIFRIERYADNVAASNVNIKL